MNRAIIIHGWEETPTGQWLPWVKTQLEAKNWQVQTPEMPQTKTPKLTEWMKTLTELSPDENTVLIGHSLANALILKYLEQPGIKIKGALLVAAWDWLMEDVREFHETFFINGFNYQKIKEKNLPISVVNSTTDPWIDFEKSKDLAAKINGEFIAIQNAGHFMAKDGYTEFPELIKIIEQKFLN